MQSTERHTFALQLNDILCFHITHYTLFGRPNEGICTCLASYMTARLAYYSPIKVRISVNYQGKNQYAQKSKLLFDRCFLHEGHMGSDSSFFDSSDAGELAVEVDEGV